MLTTHRKQTILAILKQNGQVIAKEVSQEMGVSEDTIRRDLREMAQEGLLQRVHGGALPASPAMADFAGRELLRHEGKSQSELLRRRWYKRDRSSSSTEELQRGRWRGICRWS